MSHRPRLAVLNPTCLDILAANRAWIEAQGVEVQADEEFRGLREDELLRAVADTPAMILPAAVRSFPSAAALGRLPALRVLAIAASGYEWLDVAAATRAGVVVTYSPVPEGAEVVADLAVGLMIAVARRIPWHHAQAQRQCYERGVGVSLWRKTLGIVGLGNIGRAVARRARGFEMRLLAADPRPDPAFVRDFGIEVVPLDDLLARSDFVSLHVRLEVTTRGMIGRAQLERLKPGAFLVNTARRELVDETAVLEALQAGRLGGAAIDDPPADPSSPLLRLPNYISTPHLGNRAIEGMTAVFRCAVEGAVAVLRDERPSYLLNPEVYR